MKAILPLLLCLCPVLNAQDRIIHYSYWTGVNGGKNGHIAFKIPEEELKKVPAWSPSDRTPPRLSRDQAVELAVKAAAAEGLQVSKLERMEVNLCQPDPELRKTLPSAYCLWHYEIDLAADQSHQGGSPYIYVVSMSGAVASRAAVNSR